ncbi:MAG: hypothetical protein U0263_39350 [Polyangiaceae bacterium]
MKTPILVLGIALALTTFGCSSNPSNTSQSKLETQGAPDGEDATESSAPVCVAAREMDDACEAEYGEDAAECAAFDQMDEACEAGTLADECRAAESLDDACEALYGDDAPQCAESDALDEACEAGAGVD